MVRTDSISISILKQNFNISFQFGLDLNKDVLRVVYISTLSEQELKDTENEYVLIDPGRRDLWYCLKVATEIKDQTVYRHTQNKNAKTLNSEISPNFVKYWNHQSYKH